MSSSPIAAQTVAPVLQTTRTVPIVLRRLSIPVGAGFVDSLARPGGNITGFIAFEYSLSGKWLELLKEVAPRMTRVAVFREPTVRPGPASSAVIQAAAPSVGVEVSPIDVRDAGEIEHAVDGFRAIPEWRSDRDGGALRGVHRDLIIKLAARHRLPAVYAQPLFRHQRRPDLLRVRRREPVPSGGRLR